MSFLSRLFGQGGKSEAGSAAAGAAEPIGYKECSIVAQPLREGSQWRVAGMIAKDVEGERIERKFIRADLCMSQDEAVEVSQRKAKQIIDQNPKLFSDPNDRGPV